MKAIFEVEFDPDKMCDETALKFEYGGSWFNCIKELYLEEGTGLFEHDFVLIKVEE